MRPAFTAGWESQPFYVEDPERSIVDAFRLAHTEGSGQAIEALKRWLRRGGQPSLLMRTAASFPKAVPRLRLALEVLL